MNRFVFLLSTLFLCTFAPASLLHGQTEHIEQVETLLDPLDRPDAPGGTVAIIQNGQMIYSRAFGLADLSHQVKNTPQTVFNIASLAKQFTAFSIAMLADQNQLSLDDDIRTYLPEVPDFGKPITIRHLIHHLGGFRDEYGLLQLAGWRQGDVFTTEDVLRIVSRQQSLDFDPGTLHLYSNTGYTLLGEIVARVTGSSLRDWTRTHLFEPLGMNQTEFRDDPTLVPAHLATSYEQDPSGRFLKKEMNGFNVGPGSLYTTIEDLARWAINLTEGTVGGPAVLEQIREVGVLNDGSEIDYAFGLGRGEYQGLKTLGHAGSAPGAQSDLRLYPEQNFGVIVVMNVGGRTEVLAGGLSRQMADIFLADAFEPETEEAGQPRMMMITEEDLAATPESDYDVDPARYDGYEGTYRLEDDGMLLIVSRDGDRLLVSFGEPPGIPVAPIAEDRFIMPPMNYEISFQMGSSGTATGLTFHVTEQSVRRGPVRDIAGIKQPDARPTPAELQAYAGTFYSSELDTFYRVHVEDHHLVITHPRHGSIPLSFVLADQFLADDSRVFTTVSFARDADGDVHQVSLRGYSWNSTAVFERIKLQGE